MANEITYRPGIGKSKLERLVITRLHYKNMNQFLEHAVSKTLSEEMGPNAVVKKISREVEKVIAKYVPLKFVNASPKEAGEIRESIKRSHKKGASISIKDLMKKQNIR